MVLKEVEGTEKEWPCDLALLALGFTGPESTLADKLGIDDIEHSKDGQHSKKIVICNYERLHYFNSSDFVCCICYYLNFVFNFQYKR